MNAPLGSSFSETEIAQLAARLAQITNPSALSLEGVDGFFCALIASPDAVLPSEYLQVIFGGESGESAAFADLKDANLTMSVLMRYWNARFVCSYRPPIRVGDVGQQDLAAQSMT